MPLDVAFLLPLQDRIAGWTLEGIGALVTRARFLPPRLRTVSPSSL